jgi:predicted CXXCH cytochrome family protein
MMKSVTRIVIFLTILVAHGEGQGIAFDQQTCVTCHGKEALQFRKSVHASIGLLCADCHGGDASLKTREACVDHPSFRGVPRGKDITDRCGTCHADAERMRQFGLSTDQLKIFKTASAATAHMT